MNELDSVLNGLVVEDLNEDLAYLAESVGLDTVRNLIKFAGGMRFNIPQLKSFESLLIRYFKGKDPDKIQIKKLAQTIGATDRHVANLINRRPQEAA